MTLGFPLSNDTNSSSTSQTTPPQTPTTQIPPEQASTPQQTTSNLAFRNANIITNRLERHLRAINNSMLRAITASERDTSPFLNIFAGIHSLFSSPAAPLMRAVAQEEEYAFADQTTTTADRAASTESSSTVEDFASSTSPIRISDLVTALRLAQQPPEPVQGLPEPLSEFARSFIESFHPQINLPPESFFDNGSSLFDADSQENTLTLPSRNRLAESLEWVTLPSAANIQRPPELTTTQNVNRVAGSFFSSLFTGFDSLPDELDETASRAIFGDDNSEDVPLHLSRRRGREESDTQEEEPITQRRRLDNEENTFSPTTTTSRSDDILDLLRSSVLPTQTTLSPGSILALSLTDSLAVHYLNELLTVAPDLVVFTGLNLDEISDECRVFANIFYDEMLVQRPAIAAIEGYEEKLQMMHLNALRALGNSALYHILCRAQIVPNGRKEQLHIPHSPSDQSSLILSDRNDMKKLLPLLLKLKKAIKALSDDQRTALTKSLIPDYPNTPALDGMTTEVQESIEHVRFSHVDGYLMKKTTETHNWGEIYNPTEEDISEVDDEDTSAVDLVD